MPHLRLALILASIRVILAPIFYAQETPLLANQIPQEALAVIEDVVRRHPNGVSALEILRALPAPIPPRTLLILPSATVYVWEDHQE
jgi:hypothetical protein